MTSELKPSLACFCTFFKDFLHQAAKEIVPRVGYQTREVQRLHDVEPELPGEDTRSENMLNVFVFFVAEGAMSRMWQASFFQTICCPTAISNRKPDKNLAFVRCP